MVFHQLLCHLAGDFFLQSDWMAGQKYTKKWVALLHAVTYTLPFLLLTRNPWALAIICVTHGVIDHYKVANYVAWAKNWLAPVRPKPWALCKATGYDPDRPIWLTVWLGIITDNSLHIAINYVALRYFP